MRVSSIHIRNFKRFTDVSITDIPDTSRLVLVTGPNGSGKSSLFDAFIHWHRTTTGFGINSDELYYRKRKDEQFDWGGAVTVNLYNGKRPERSSLYVRSAYRNDPDFTIGGLSRLAAPSDNVRVARSIDNDQTVSENYQRLVYETVTGVYDETNDQKTVQALREELIGQVRESMKHVFGDLILNNIADPLGGGTFFFRKGSAMNYHYKNLSGGEKAAFDLLLDMHIKKRFYPDAVYCIDELETHLHTAVQGVLLRELVDILPATSQLWVTTHSLGVMRAALELATSMPGAVALIDFHGVTPDIQAELRPSSVGRATWEKMLSIALDDLSTRVTPRHIVVCEGSSVGTRRKDFDAEIYNRVFAQHAGDIVFVSGGGSSQVKAASNLIERTLQSVASSSWVGALIDRDDRSDAEVKTLRATGSLVLERRNLESYLFDDGVIEALVNLHHPPALAEALAIKKAAIASSISRGNPPDDLKSAAGDIYTGLKKLLKLTRCGNNTDEFMRDTLAPLIGHTMGVYKDLRTCIIDVLPPH